ncbi:hypothetical protein LTR95_013236 [Oleoguttula sp. CCFEE 5521]
MPGLRPFPMPALGVGTDICAINRIARIINRIEGYDVQPASGERGRLDKVHPVRTDSLARLDHLTRRMFTPYEQWRFKNRFAKDISDLREHCLKPAADITPKEAYYAVTFLARFLAGRWAAKEAVIKACHWRKLCMDEVQILVKEDSKQVYGVILDQASWDDNGHIHEIGRAVEEAMNKEQRKKTAARLDRLHADDDTAEDPGLEPGPGIVVRSDTQDPIAPFVPPDRLRTFLVPLLGPEAIAKGLAHRPRDTALLLRCGHPSCSKSLRPSHNINEAGGRQDEWAAKAHQLATPTLAARAPRQDLPAGLLADVHYDPWTWAIWYPSAPYHDYSARRGPRTGTRIAPHLVCRALHESAHATFYRTIAFKIDIMAHAEPPPSPYAFHEPAIKSMQKVILRVQKWPTICGWRDAHQVTAAKKALGELEAGVSGTDLHIAFTDLPDTQLEHCCDLTAAFKHFCNDGRVTVSLVNGGSRLALHPRLAELRGSFEELRDRLLA